MPLRSISSAYLKHAHDLEGNPAQKAAYDSIGHCVVLAGPGSGKTKTLVLKLARILAEDVRVPRGVACITYSHECARELIRRIGQLGLGEEPNLFIGTVHGFCLRHLLLPYARLTDLPVPFPLSVATQDQCNDLMKRAGNKLFGKGHSNKAVELGRFRRSILNRGSDEWKSQEELASWALTYEEELRRIGLVDFDDLVIFGLRLVTEHDWILPIIQAKIPVLVVDEYQDLGIALHEIVTRIAFHGHVRLFAVGDPDQSIYGFTGADGTLLRKLTEKENVEKVQLQLNYRSASRIVKASELVLGESRGYESNDPDREAVIDFVKCGNGLEEQAQHAVTQIIPLALAAKPSRTLGDIAILYRDRRIGDVVSAAVTDAELDFVRVDAAAPYRKVVLTSWIEDCAAWCSGGWRVGYPRLRDLISRWHGLHRIRLNESEMRMATQRISETLWSLRSDNGPADEFVESLRISLLNDLMSKEASLTDQREQVDRMSKALTKGGVIAGLDIARLGGRDTSPNQLNLLTLHSAKGCEYDVVIMVGLDLGAFPWRNEAPTALRESRRLFYVGLTRARDEVYMLYSGFVETQYGKKVWGRSPFLDELETRLQEAENA